MTKIYLGVNVGIWYLADFKRHDKVLHVLGSVFLDVALPSAYRAKGDGIVWEERPVADGRAGSVVEEILLRACVEGQQKGMKTMFSLKT